MERNRTKIIQPIRLQDFLFAGLTHEKCALRYGVIITYVLQTFVAVERFLHLKKRWYKHSPIWNNLNLLTGGKPFSLSAWAQKGIQGLEDIAGHNSILEFQDLASHYGISKNSFFFYLRLTSALKAYNVPWGTDLICHPIVDWILGAEPKGKASFIYKQLMTYSTVLFPGSKLWEKDLKQWDGIIHWDTVWKSIPSVSKNPNHQFIHFKICHRTNMTSRIRHLMGLAPHPF